MKDERGQSMVEMALVLPILLLILLGITEFGRIYYTQLAITNGARAGARYAAVHNDLTKTYVAQQTFPGNTIKQTELTDANTTNGNITIVYNPSPRATDGTVTITETYPVKIFAPLISSITGNPRVVTASVTMRIE